MISHPQVQAVIDAVPVDVGVTTDLYNAGAQEDGVPFIAERIRIQATADDGRRWCLGTWSFATARRVLDEEGCPHFTDDRDEGHAIAGRILSRIAARGALDPSKWDAERPVYGSDAYVGGDWSLRDLMDERETDRGDV